MTKYAKHLSDAFPIEDLGLTTTLYKKLIRNWHERATEEDYFSKFVFEYLAFNAILRKYISAEESNDRKSVQELKRKELIQKIYLKRINGNKDLEDLIYNLKKYPLNDSEELKWWDCSEQTTCHAGNKGSPPSGYIRDNKDWENIVEFIYIVRNNLFHGGKDPEDARDQYFVEHAYKLLRPLVEILLGEIGIGVDH